MNLLVDEPYSHPSPYLRLVPQTIAAGNRPASSGARQFRWALIDLLLRPCGRASRSTISRTPYAIPARGSSTATCGRSNGTTCATYAVVMVWTEIALDFTGWAFEAVD
jgi:hypothetical protein